jgi:hypothetical protein
MNAWSKRVEIISIYEANGNSNFAFMKATLGLQFLMESGRLLSYQLPYIAHLISTPYAVRNIILS